MNHNESETLNEKSSASEGRRPLDSTWDPSWLGPRWQRSKPPSDEVDLRSCSENWNRPNKMYPENTLYYRILEEPFLHI